MKYSENLPIHCKILHECADLFGFISISSTEISAHIYGYGNFFFINPDDPIYFLTSENQIVSMHSNFSKTLSHSTIFRSSTRTVYHQKIISNLAVVGHEEWKADDLVKRAIFKVNKSDSLLKHRDKIEFIVSNFLPKSTSRLIFEFMVSGLKLQAWYTFSYKSGLKSPIDISPVFCVEFDQPVAIHDYITYVSDYARFLSFCLGTFLVPTDFQIDRLYGHEIASAIEKEIYDGSYEVHYLWSEAEVNSQDLWVGGSPFLVCDDEELEAFCGGLSAWMERAPVWRKAYALMIKCFEQKNEITAERLVNACRWFEQIPTSKAKAIIPESAIDIIAAAAGKAGEDLGLDAQIQERVASAVKRIKTETSNQQFQRLLNEIEEKFKSSFLMAGALPHLKRALLFRGKTAHGFYSPNTEDEFASLQKSIAALEALCFLLTAIDLPINEKGRGRIGSNPLIRDYRTC